MQDYLREVDSRLLQKLAQEQLHASVATQVHCSAPAAMDLTVATVAMLVGMAESQATVAWQQQQIVLRLRALVALVGAQVVTAAVVTVALALLDTQVATVELAV